MVCIGFLYLGKEMSEFDGGLSRKSCSTCSITCAKIRANSKDDEPVLERRLSDTVLTWKDERQPSKLLLVRITICSDSVGPLGVLGNSGQPTISLL